MRDCFVSDPTDENFSAWVEVQADADVRERCLSQFHSFSGNQFRKTFTETDEAIETLAAALEATANKLQAQAQEIEATELEQCKTIGVEHTESATVKRLRSEAQRFSNAALVTRSGSDDAWGKYSAWIAP